jgi:uncharacterized protein YdhG (YjbR/CyaY superfamily)
MQSRATTVAAYLDEVPADRHSALEALRGLCVETLIGYEEVMAYGGPCYKNDGVIEVGFASQKNFVALYVLKKGVVDAFRAELVGASFGKGCIRFSKPEKMDFAVIERLLAATRDSTEPAC